MNSKSIARQIILDTETTGMNFNGKPEMGHKIIEIGALEMINRRLTGNHFHFYLNPEREIEQEAFKVHGISNEFVKDKPKFKEVMTDFMAFIDGAELIIHNAPFDLAFLNQELRQAGRQDRIEDHTKIIDTLQMARALYPGKRNSLDALSQRYLISHHDRTFHGALLDSEILAEVYLSMTGGQTDLMFQEVNVKPPKSDVITAQNREVKQSVAPRSEAFKVIQADEEEQSAHEAMLALIRKKSKQAIDW